MSRSNLGWMLYFGILGGLNLGFLMNRLPKVFALLHTNEIPVWDIVIASLELIGIVACWSGFNINLQKWWDNEE